MPVTITFDKPLRSQHIGPVIQHLPQQAAQELVPPSSNSLMISITDPRWTPAQLEEGWIAVLRQQFHDIEVVHGNFTRFSWAQALEIVDFLHVYRQVDHIVVHCRFGASRSAAVALYAAFMHDIQLGGSALGYNHFVFWRLLEAHAARAVQRGDLKGAVCALWLRLLKQAPIKQSERLD